MSEFALESKDDDEKDDKYAASGTPPPPIPADTMLQWLTCFQVTENATNEVDIRSILAYIQPSTSSGSGKPGKKQPKKPPFRKGVAEMLQSGQKRQELLYGSLPFAQLQEKCARWTTLMYFWIHARVHACTHYKGPDGLDHDEVQRYLHFLATASSFLGAFPTHEVEALLLSLDKKKHGGAPKSGMADEVQQLHAALADCVDAANKDTLQITWDFIRPSSVPTIVLEHLREYGPEWLNGSQHIRSAMDLGYLSSLSSRKPHRRSSSTPPQSSSFLALQYLWETKSMDMKYAFHPRLLYQFEWTLEHIGYLMLGQLSSEKVDRAFFAVPVLVDFTCAVETYKELCANVDKEQAGALHKALPSLSSSHDGIIRALQSAVDLCFERHSHDILEHYSEMNPTKDVIRIDGSKKVAVSTCMFRLLVEVIEPALCLLRRYAEVLETCSASCPGWQRGLDRSIESLWKSLSSSALRTFEAVHVSGDAFTKRMKADGRLLNFYLQKL